MSCKLVASWRACSICFIIYRQHGLVHTFRHLIDEWKRSQSAGSSVISESNECQLKSINGVEFPAVLLRLSTGEIEAVFCEYVRPIESPVLSNFCTHFTGITQSMVDSALPLNLILSRFVAWLEDISVRFDLKIPNSCVFATWTDWDLGLCLHRECRRKKIKFPSMLSSWVDLKAVFERHYGRDSGGLAGAMKRLGLEFDGREHCGLDDAKNTARLAHRLYKDGCAFQLSVMNK